MALALRSAAQLKPEIQLSRALHDFEEILSEQEKAQFNEFKTESPPSASAPLAFTSFLDRSLQNRLSRRCIGPRMINLLQSTQQFSTVIDVVVGGSQNLLASSIWGIMKLSLQIGSNYTHFFDKLSILFRDIGRTCPQFQELGILFAESKGLQRIICEYFATFINLCKDVVLFSRKPFIAQLPKLILPFERTFLEIQATLHRLSAAVQDEVTLASSKHQKKESSLHAGERKENAGFRALATRALNQGLTATRLSNQQHTRQLRSDFLRSLSDYNHMTSWKQARSKGTVNWILDDHEYNRWKTGASSKVVRLVGNLGSGKTVVMASIIADLVLQNNVAVSYFFCKYDDIKSLKAKTVIGSLVKQMLSDLTFNIPDPPPLISDVDDVVGLLTGRALVWLGNRDNFFCLDGIGECEDGERDQIVLALLRLSASPNVKLKILYSTRADTQCAIAQPVDEFATISMPSGRKSTEISDYIRTSLEYRLALGRLTLGDPTLILRVAEILEEKSSGMYLWVYFQLESICEQQTDQDIIQTLENLPRDMQETYTRILSRTKGRLSLVQTIFAIITAAERPLSTEELREALALEPGKTVLAADSLVNDISKCLNQCGGSLLIIDEEDSTVRFVHESVRQFLTSSAKDDGGVAQYHVDTKRASSDLGARCVTYLNLGVFNTQLAKARDSASWKSVSPSKIMNSSLAGSNVSVKLAMSLLGGGKDVQYDIGRQLERVAAAANPTTELTYAFLPYAKTHVFGHTKELVECDPVLDSMFCKTYNGNLPFVPQPWPHKEGEVLGDTTIFWAVVHEHLGLIYRYLRRHALGRKHESSSAEGKFEKVSGKALGKLLRWSFDQQKVEIFRLILGKVHMEPPTLMALLIPITAFARTLLDEWRQLVDLKEHVIPFGVVDDEQLGQHKNALRPQRMLYIDDRLYTETASTKWDSFAIAAAYNSIEAIESMKPSRGLTAGELDELQKLKLLRLLLGGLREAACRRHVEIFKSLLSSFPLSLFREVGSHISAAEYDEYGWTPLHYAATFPDVEVYQNLRDNYYAQTNFAGGQPHPRQLLFGGRVSFIPDIGDHIPQKVGLPFELDSTRPLPRTPPRIHEISSDSELPGHLIQHSYESPLDVTGGLDQTVVSATLLTPTWIPVQSFDLNPETIVPNNPERQTSPTDYSLDSIATSTPAIGVTSSEIGAKSVNVARERYGADHQPLRRAGAVRRYVVDVGPGKDPSISKCLVRRPAESKAEYDTRTPLEQRFAAAPFEPPPSEQEGKRDSLLSSRQKPWWENPLLVFLMFVLWPSIVACCLFYIKERRQGQWEGAKICVCTGDRGLKGSLI